MFIFIVLINRKLDQFNRTVQCEFHDFFYFFIVFFPSFQVNFEREQKMAFQSFLYCFSLRSGCIIIGLLGLFINIACAQSFAPNDIIESIIFTDFLANVLLIGGAAMHKRFCVLTSIAINIMFNVLFWMFVWLVIRRSDSVSIGIVLLEHIAVIHLVSIKIMCDHFDELQKQFAQSHSCVQRKYCFDIRCCDCKINYNLRLEVFTKSHYDKWQCDEW